MGLLARETMRSKTEAIGTAAALMAGFAERTGLTSDRPARRYLGRTRRRIGKSRDPARAIAQRGTARAQVAAP